jgi:hypothetical protein
VAAALAVVLPEVLEPPTKGLLAAMVVLALSPLAAVEAVLQLPVLMLYSKPVALAALALLRQLQELLYIAQGAAVALATTVMVLEGLVAVASAVVTQEPLIPAVAVAVQITTSLATLVVLA